MRGLLTAVILAACTPPPDAAPDGPCPSGYVQGEGNLCLLIPSELHLADDAEAAEFCRWHTRVAGDLFIETEGTALPELPCLTEVDGDLLIEGLSSLEDATLPALRRVGGALHVAANPELARISLPVLEEVGTDLAIEYNTKLHGLETPVLHTIGSDLWVYQSMSSADGGPDGPLGDPSFYWAVEAPLLASVGRNVYIRLNWLLERVSFPALEQVGGLFKLTGNEQLTSVDLPTLDSSGGFWISFNAALQQIDLPDLDHLDGQLFHLEATGLRSATFPHLAQVPALEFMENHHQTVLDLPALVTIQGHFDVHDNPGLESLVFWRLASVGTDFRVQRNPGLPTSEVDELVDRIGADHIGGDVVVEDNGAD